jgi:RNA polymerase sigma-70 factor (ECF subfamily)
VVTRHERATEDSDSALNFEAALLECAAGDTSAVAEIYVAERHQLRAMARSIVRDGDRAEDVIHDAFAQILRDAKSFDPARGSARAWIYAIVRNTAVKNRRKAFREVSVPDDTLHSFREESQSVAAEAARLAEDTDLRSSLEQLEPRRCASLILAIIDGRTHAEIAQCLGVPVGTVKAWIRRELIALRKRLG